MTFVYNGQTLPVTGTGKVVTGEQYMDTATIVLPAEYQEQYKVRAEKVKVIRENGTRKAVVELRSGRSATVWARKKCCPALLRRQR